MTRREFIAAAGAVPLLGKPKTLDRFACNSWPFRAYFDTPSMHKYRDPNLPLLTQADFPQFLADQFGIHNVEFLPQHFADTNVDTVRNVKQGLQKAHSRCCNLMGVDLKSMIEDFAHWADIANTLSAPSVTVALTGQGNVDVPDVTEALRPAAAELRRRGLKLLFHNDDIRRETAETLVAIIRSLGTERAGACPDFGNFAPRSADFALAELKSLAPFASSICHAKDGIAEGGKFYADDFAASIRVMRSAGFRGLYSIEFEGLGDPVTGVKHLMQLTADNLS